MLCQVLLCSCVGNKAVIRDYVSFPACSSFDVAVFFHKDEVQDVTGLVS